MTLPFLLFTVCSCAVHVCERPGVSGSQSPGLSPWASSVPELVDSSGSASYSCLFPLQQVWHWEAPLPQPHKPLTVTSIPHAQLHFLQFTTQPAGDQQDRLGKRERRMGSVPLFSTGRGKREQRMAREWGWEEGQDWHVGTREETLFPTTGQVWFGWTAWRRQRTPRKIPKDWFPWVPSPFIWLQEQGRWLLPKIL